MDLHEIEEREFGRGPRLWDADPDVCCAAFQLGACEHTEYFDEERDLDELLASLTPVAVEVLGVDEEGEEPAWAFQYDTRSEEAGER
jgi:hypothetical protein